MEPIKNNFGDILVEFFVVIQNCIQKSCNVQNLLTERHPDNFHNRLLTVFGRRKKTFQLEKFFFFEKCM
jgi:hypothetical protein